MTEGELDELAYRVRYVGSGHHKDVPAMGIVPRPRPGAIRVEAAERNRINNPDCTLCPRKWARRTIEAATELLRAGVRLGQVSTDAGPDSLPARVWVRDPQQNEIVYEAKRLSYPVDGYKAYPLTSRQSRNLPLPIR
jgi:hypothetical protein